MGERTKLKKKLWKLTSEYVRRKNTDYLGYTFCVTCGKVKHWKQLQAGHFIPQAQGDAVKFDLRNIHVQCYRCNINLGGNGPEYYSFMLNTYGQALIDELKFTSNQKKHFSLIDLEEMVRDIEGRLKRL